MRSQHVPMTFEDWDRMPWRFGWKHEYWDGCAHSTPRHNHVLVNLRVAPRSTSFPPHVALRAVEESDAEALSEMFIETFVDGVEFCDWETESIHEHARRNITNFFAGRRGAPHASSRIAVSTDDETTANGEANVVSSSVMLAASLLTQKSDAVMLDLLMVRPGHRRRGIADLLVSANLIDLHAHGETVLRSAYHVANAESATWHQSFGFTEEPDLHLARLRQAFYYHEMTRRDGIEESETADHDDLKTDYEFWRVRVEELEEIYEREGYEAVTPTLRLDW